MPPGMPRGTPTREYSASFVAGCSSEPPFRVDGPDFLGARLLEESRGFALVERLVTLARGLAVGSAFVAVIIDRARRLDYQRETIARQRGVESLALDVGQPVVEQHRAKGREAREKNGALE